jgi:threonine synthase
MYITIRFFAALRDRAGLNETQLELKPPATVRTLLERIAREYPALEAALPTALVAVNHEFAFADDDLQDGDEVAFFPPVSGGMGDDPGPAYLAITADELNIEAIVSTITRPETGAVCAFSGVVRGVTQTADGRLNTDHLFYEAYQPMAEGRLKQVADEIREQYPQVQGIAIVQRVGKLQVGATSVVVACSSAHRTEGVFEAARYGIDRLKEIVPVWKKEFGADGSAWVEGKYRPTPDDVARPREGNAQEYIRMREEPRFAFVCARCGERYPLNTPLFRCSCGHPFELTGSPPFERSMINTSDFSIWRYRAMLIPPDVTPITLGEGWTPLIATQVGGRTVHLKLESLNPTGSFKDRGAALLVTMLRAQGIDNIHDDSSGNAGAALAAYAARAGLSARLFAPASASPAKLSQIRIYGAELSTIAGPRSDAAKASVEAAEAGTSVYASHIYNPFAIQGYKTIAYELWEQLGFQPPDVIIVPLGHGSQILGLADGFADLVAAGLITDLPRLIGVQAETCAPLWRLYHQNGDADEVTTEGQTMAEGIRILDPIRATDVLKAIRNSDGDVVCVSEEAIRNGLLQLAKRGISAEPTSAVVWPGFEQVAEHIPEETILVLSITGSGFKTPDLDTLLEHDSPYPGNTF